MEILLLRHGKTEGNTKRQYIGRTDEPLCALGIAEAEAVRGLPKAPRVFVSPMLRARETAAILFPGAEQICLDDLREMDFGIFERRSADDMENDAQYRAWVEGGCVAPCPGGESIASFSERVLAAFYSAVETAISAGESRLVVVAHGGTIMAIMHGCVESSVSYYNWFAPNCGGWRVTLDERAWPAKRVFTDLQEAGNDDIIKRAQTERGSL